MRVYTDAARDDEVVGIGWHIALTSGRSVSGGRYMFGNYTSMEAEYFALLDGLRLARRHETGHIEVFCDCKPLVKKLEEGTVSANWYDRRKGFHRLLDKFDSWEVEWTPRTSNEDADREAFEYLEEGRRQ